MVYKLFFTEFEVDGIYRLEVKGFPVTKRYVFGLIVLVFFFFGGVFRGRY